MAHTAHMPNVQSEGRSAWGQRKKNMFPFVETAKGCRDTARAPSLSWL